MERREKIMIETKARKNQKRRERKAETDAGEDTYCRYLIHFDIFK